MKRTPNRFNAQRPTDMKKKTSNAERRTPNAEWPIIRWIGNGRVKEDAPEYGAARKTNSTSNAQRPTSNVQQKRQPRFDLEERLLEFSARIIRLVDALPNTRAGNHGEVEAAESRKDFVHKLKVCLKELKETRRWLRLIERSRMLPEKSLAPILAETEELIRIFFTSIRTAEQNAK